MFSASQMPFVLYLAVSFCCFIIATFGISENMKFRIITTPLVFLGAAILGLMWPIFFVGIVASELWELWADWRLNDR